MPTDDGYYEAVQSINQANLVRGCARVRVCLSDGERLISTKVFSGTKLNRKRVALRDVTRMRDIAVVRSNY